MTDERPQRATDESFERGLASGLDPMVGLREVIRDTTWTTKNLRNIGRVEAALDDSPSGEGLVVNIPDGGVGLGLHLSGPQRVASRYEGERWREYVDLRGSVSVIVSGRSLESVGIGPSEDLHVLLPGDLVRNVGNEVGAAPGGLEFIPALAVPDETMAHLMAAFADEVAGGGLGGRLYTEGLANALAVHLLHRYSSLGERRKGELSSGGSAVGVPAKTVRRALEFIGDNLTGDLSLADIARAANLSESHLHRLFREAVGVSPHQYVIRERVEEAKALLRRTDLTIAEVAVSSGFSHHQHLNRHFKRLTGSSPERFRRESGHSALREGRNVP